MRYKINVQFWGYRDCHIINAKSAKHRDDILKELFSSYSVTHITIDKVLKSGKIIPVKSIIRYL